MTFFRVSFKLAGSRNAAMGALWYLMVPYGTLWYLMVPYVTLWYLMVPYVTL